MRCNVFPCVFLLALGLAPLTNAQESDKATDEAIRQASEAAKKMGIEMPDIKKLMEEDEKEEAKEEATKKAKVQAAMNAPGPVALPDWTPKVPEFTPTGPVAKKVVDDKPEIVQTGTSPLTPMAIADAWENEWEKLGKNQFSLGRLSSNINDTIRHTVTYTLMDGVGEVKLEATRAPRAKVTQVVVSSPLPTPADKDDD